MTKEFCPDSCGFKNEGRVKGACDVCSHSQDREVKPFLGSFFGIILKIVGKGKMGDDEQYYLDDGSSMSSKLIKRK